jgi:hypothetical protein
MNMENEEKIATFIKDSYGLYIGVSDLELVKESAFSCIWNDRRNNVFIKELKYVTDTSYLDFFNRIFDDDFLVDIGTPMIRNVDNSISFEGHSYYYGYYNPDPYNDSRTFCGYGPGPANTDAQVSGMAYYALNGGAGGGRTVVTDSPYGTSGFTVAASISGNDITCTMTNNTGSDQWIYPYTHNGGSTYQLWYWGWFYTGEYASSVFDFSTNRGTWNNQSANTYGLPLYSYIQIVLNVTTYDIFKPHQSGATQATVISDIKSALESALSGTGVTINNYTNGIQIISPTTTTITYYLYYFPNGTIFINEY